MHEFIAFTIGGLVFGAVYAVAASGLVVTYATTGIFNISHGAIGMVMAFVYWQFSVGWHWPVAAALAFTVLVVAPAFGVVFERVIRPVANASVTTRLVITIGFTVGLIGVAQTVWTGTDRQLPNFFGNHGFHLASVLVTWEQVITIATAIGVALGLRLLLFGTRVGITMRGVVDNRGLVALNGGRPVRIGILSWAVGSSMAAMAGILVAQQLHVLSVLTLTLLVVDAYAAAMFGRLRNLPLTFVGALSIALIQSYWSGYRGQGGFWDSVPIQGLGLSIPAIILFIVLLVLPQDQLRGATLSARRLVSSIPTFARSVQGGVALVVAIVIVTQFLGPGNMVYMGTGLAFSLIMLSLVPLIGWGGQMSLCPMTFAGIGAVAMFHFGKGGSPLGLLAAAGVTAAVGTVIALPALRLRGLYLALATLAFALCMDEMFFPTSTAFSYNGSVAIPRPSAFGIHMTSARSYVIFLSVVFALLSIGLLALRRGPFGRVLSAMKDSEAACATLGLNLTLTKLVVFALSAGIAGFAGALFGAARSVAGATDFLTFQSLPILLLLVIGGVSTCTGALLGGVAYGFGPAVQTQISTSGNYPFLIIGGLSIASIRRYPDGVMPPFYNAIAQWWQGVVGGSTAIGPDTPGTPGGVRPAGASSLAAATPAELVSAPASAGGT